MASDPDFVAYVCEQMRGAGSITSKKMFGEYGLYIDGVIFAFVCDNQVFFKPTPAGRAWLGDALTQGQAYPGSKLYFTAGEHVEDAHWMTELARVTARDLPLPKAKPAKAPARRAHAKQAAGEKSAAKKAAPRKPAMKAPALKRPAVKKPVAKKPVAKKAATKTAGQAAQKTSAKQAAAKG